jgi:hypothetical protein
LPAAPEYVHEEEAQQIAPEVHDVVENYTYSEPQQQVVSDNWGEEPLPEEPPSFSNEMAVAPEEPVQAPPVPLPHVDEPVCEPVKKTYASIVCHFLLAVSFYLFGILPDASLKLHLTDSCS